VKTKEVTRKQRAAVDRLPLGATSEDAWTRVVIPTFINVMLSGDKPWASCEADLAPTLQNVWNHTYGSKVPFKIQKGTVPFELASKFLISSKILTSTSFRLIRSFVNTEIILPLKPSLSSMVISGSSMLMKNLKTMNLKTRLQSLLTVF